MRELQDDHPHEIEVNGVDTWISDRALDKLNATAGKGVQMCHAQSNEREYVTCYSHRFRAGHLPWGCTRDAGHDGPHVAHELDFPSNSALTCAVWR